MKNDNVNDNNSINIIRGFAIFSVICAHVAHVNSNYSKINIIAGNIIGSIGTIGVPIFFIISGYLFAKGNHSVRNFFEKKATNLILPWTFTGSIVYFYVSLRKGGIGLSEYMKFLIGNGSYLYYLTILMIFYFVFFRIRNTKIVIYFILVLSIFSIHLTSKNLLGTLNPYLNPLNWAVYFCIGLNILNYNLFNKVLQISKRTFIIWVLVLVVFCYRMIQYNDSITYWSDYYFLFIISNSMIIIKLSTVDRIRNCSLISKFGSKSFSIYLLHMPFAGIITNLTNRFDNALLTLIRPLLTICLVFVFIIVYENILEAQPRKKFLKLLVGLRD